jgi:hypothetical protein
MASPLGQLHIGGRRVFGSDRKERLRFEMAGGPSSACTTLGANTGTGFEHGQGAYRAAVGFGCNDRWVPYHGRALRYLCSRASNSELNRNLLCKRVFSSQRPLSRLLARPR